MPKYVLTYFNVRARGELSRLALVYAGADWEDKRLQLQGETWQELKPDSQLKVLPELSVEGGYRVSESTVIPQYIAEKHDFGGSNAEERGLVCMIVKHLDDLFVNLGKGHFEKDEAKKAELIKELGEKHLPNTLENLEQIAQANGKGVLVGDNITTADLQLHNIAFNLLRWKDTVLDAYPTLKTIYAKVVAVPSIADWLKSRPESQY
ncbi:glutathione S-transferase 1-like [Sycon ciliatum]|uniref:glutathione S-transferase 1-like n=1 Tax=Sycon ciliatum TaxID=27933 RepID=UPI0031F62267